VLIGPAAPIAMTIALPKGLTNGLASRFQLLVSQIFPDGFLTSIPATYLRVTVAVN
jgi:hypothetical protein